MSDVNRRQAITTLAAGAALTSISATAASPTQASLGLGFSLYGMRSLSLAEAVKHCAQIGYDCIELTVTAGWPADSAKFDAPQRAALRSDLAAADMRLSALMENLPIFGDAARHRANLKRLELAGEVAHDIVSAEDDSPPMVETILGGRPSQWPAVRDDMARRLEDWARVAEKAKIVVAIKAHVGGAMHLPQHPVALVKKVDSPWIRAAYDYSHFWLRNVDMAASIKTLAKATVFVHVKDAAGDASQVKFLLPGQGDIDYVKLLQGLVEQGYQGDIVVEVSGQIHGRPGYDPVKAAQTSYTPLAKAMKAANIQRT